MEEQYSTEGRRFPLSVHMLKPGFGVLMALFLSILVLFTMSRLTPPGEVSATASSTEFSSGRAMKHLEVICQRPHPIGSLEHAAVRKYIISELSTLGLQAEVQEAISVSSGLGVLRAATVRNIVARLKGTGGGKAL